MSPAKKKKPSPPKKKKQQFVRVRMYDVGFGDAFLILFPDGDRTRTMLVDCGTIHSGAHGAIDDVARRIVADVSELTGEKHIDVVVATHRHKDHVAGFDSDVWNDVGVGEVWLPWTEDPNDAEATRIRNKQAALAAALAAERPGRPISAISRELAINALSNAAAMNTLHRGFRARALAEPRYLPEPDRAKATFTSAALPGVTVRVLGPSRLESVIKDMDPPSGESYFAALAAAAGDGTALGAGTFASKFIMSAAAYGEAHGLRLRSDLEHRLQTAGDMDDLDLAATLESAVNGTSLMLILDVGSVRLLLPGDAQWGTWQAALSDPEWGPLFSGATFYKIGHHGSHNATPRRFVENAMKSSIPAMASVTAVKQWKSIPLPTLLDAMRTKKSAQVARSDQPASAPKTAFTRADDDAWIEAALPI